MSYKSLAIVHILLDGSLYHFISFFISSIISISNSLDTSKSLSYKFTTPSHVVEGMMSHNYFKIISFIGLYCFSSLCS